MIGIGFGWFSAAWLLLLVPVVWLVLRAFDGRSARRLEATVGPRAARLTTSSGKPRIGTRALLLGGLAFAVLAAMQPSWGKDVRRVEVRGVDLVVCLDVSRSMLARDMRPSRLERAKLEIRSLADRTRGDRLGLVVFAGEARVRIPLTKDTATFADLVDAVDTLSVDRGGTDLGAALEAALAALSSAERTHEAVLLISDGEDHAQRGLRMAQVAKERKVAVHCVGIGSAFGSKITVMEGPGESFLKARSGDDVISAMDASGLRRIAETTGGGFVQATASPTPLLELYERHVVPQARGAFLEEERGTRKNRFQWPLLVAFALWMMALGLGARDR